MIHPYLIALYTLIKKEINRFIRIWIQTLIPPIMTILLYFIIFGNFISNNINKISGFSYVQFITPGLIMMSIINNSYSNVASSLFNAKFNRSIEELLIAPIPTNIIILGYISGGILRSIIICIFLTITATFFISLHIYSWLFFIIFIFLTSVLFSLLGLLTAIFAKNFDDINFIPTFILTPLTYLGGVFYTTNILSSFWQKILKINPIYYIISVFRYSFLGIHTVSLFLTIKILFFFIVILYLLIFILIEKKICLLY
ncbi:ABC transporter permease [Enterobacteriaceae endosymbiont of Donacia cincticornis]|uniref:ABC transporter permease n=1 Tax=Enterobacteriaceae endosymbiont of Donacia cincticornis TaxID=2675773 RepID=UPI001449F0FE|nr:ABC transporter permease [Enterobacteriaceae endosymbiont of Donacia cincticornis]QJC36312.1 ABC transporter permease [Enterobacteriaceae endosymbiont of Donacia cincticornis]